MLTFSATAATCISAIDAIQFQRPHTGDQVLVIAVGGDGGGGGSSTDDDAAADADDMQLGRNLHRELLKSYAGFSVRYCHAQDIVTGAWGCGAFRGDR